MGLMQQTLPYGIQGGEMGLKSLFIFNNYIAKFKVPNPQQVFMRKTIAKICIKKKDSLILKRLISLPYQIIYLLFKILSDVKSLMVGGHILLYDRIE